MTKKEYLRLNFAVKATIWEFIRAYPVKSYREFKIALNRSYNFSPNRLDELAPGLEKATIKRFWRECGEIRIKEHRYDHRLQKIQGHIKEIAKEVSDIRLGIKRKEN